MKPHCPYCTKEISSDGIQCPSCGTIYGLETLLLIKKFVKEAVIGYPDEQRKYDRVPKKIKVSYATPKTLAKYYLTNIGQGGIFIPTKDPLQKREKVNLKIILPDGGKEVEVFGEVVRSHKEKRTTPKGKYSQGMGIKFLNLSYEDKERIIRVLRQSTP